MAPTPIADAGYADPQYQGVPSSRRVFVRWKVAMGSPGEEMELDWPDSWPLPQPGDLIHWGDKHYGILLQTQFDVPGQRIVLQVR
jgi:hypothetical protein